MALNRRNTLIGLGTLAVGGGALAATGAFTTVEANRTVEVQAVGDASALLGFVIDTDTPGDNSPVVDIVNGLLEIDFAAAGNAGGINLDARTTVGITNDNSNPASISAGDEAFKIVNNGGQAVDVSFAINYHGDQSGETIDGNPIENHLQLWTDVSGAAATIDGGDFGNLVATDITALDSGEEALVVLQVETLGLDSTDVNISSPLFDSPATITADST